MALTLTTDRDRPDDRSLVLAAEVIQAGGIILYPTETLYGIGANALNEVALQKVPVVKRRKEQKPILVVASGIGMVESLAAGVSPVSRALMEALWPGPLTLILDAAAGISPVITAGTGTIGVRVPSSRLCLRLVELCDCPVTSTSANISGGAPLLTIEQIRASLPVGIDLYLDAGPLPSGIPSTVVDARGAGAKIIRPGAVSRDQIARVVSIL